MMWRKRLRFPVYHHFIVMLSGSGVGFIIQYRKFERGFDSFLNIRLLILMMVFSLVTLWVWKLECFLVSSRLATPLEKTSKRFFYSSYVGLALFFLYPLAKHFILKDWHTSFRWMGLIVFLSLVVLQLIGLATALRGLERKPELTWSWQVPLFLVLIGVLYYFHQVSYFHSFVDKEPVYSNLTIDSETRRSVACVSGEPFRFLEETKLFPEGDLIIGFAALDLAEGEKEDYEVSVKLVDTAGSIIEKRSQAVQAGNGWAEAVFEIGPVGEEKVFVEIQCSPIRHGLFRPVAKKMVSYLGLPWLEPRGSLIAFTRPRMVAAASEEFPNVILISIDTLRADYVGAYGGIGPTPAMDSLSKDGILFKNAIAPSTWTLSSHMSIMTSLYPSYHGINDATLDISDPHLTTLAETFQDLGYATAAFTGNLWISSKFGFSKGFDLYYEKGGGKHNEAEDIFVRAKRWLRRHKNTRYFLFIHTYETHNYVLLKEHHMLYTDDGYQGTFMSPEFGRILSNLGFQREEYRITEDDLRFIRDLYRGSILATDIELEKFLIYLRSQGLYQDALIVLTSDHGESFGELHNSDFAAWYHRNIPYEEQARVPLIIKPPSSKSLPKNISFEGRISCVDIAPTILDICGFPIPEGFQGVPLTNFAADDLYDPNRHIFSEQPEIGIVALYSGKHAHIHYANAAEAMKGHKDELYDLSSDQGQKKNLLETEDSKDLSRVISSYLTRSRKHRKENYEKKELGEDFKARLRAVGYF